MEKRAINPLIINENHLYLVADISVLAAIITLRTNDSANLKLIARSEYSLQ
jgi:hypothetical protein